MGRMTIKKKPIKKDKVPYNQEMNDMKEWQDNQYNPGYYIGTGRVPYPLRRISKRPKLKLLYLLYSFGPLVLAAFFTDITWYQIAGFAAVAAVFGVIIYDSRKHVG